MFDDLDDPSPPLPDAGRSADAVARGRRRLRRRRLAAASSGMAVVAVVALAAVTLWPTGNGGRQVATATGPSTTSQPTTSTEAAATTTTEPPATTTTAPAPTTTEAPPPTTTEPAPTTTEPPATTGPPPPDTEPPPDTTEPLPPPSRFAVSCDTGEEIPIPDGIEVTLIPETTEIRSGESTVADLILLNRSEDVITYDDSSSPSRCDAGGVYRGDERLVSIYCGIYDQRVKHESVPPASESRRREGFRAKTCPNPGQPDFGDPLPPGRYDIVGGFVAWGFDEDDSAAFIAMRVPIFVTD